MDLPAPIDKLTIVHYPSPVLRRRCAPIETFDDELAAVARQLETLFHEAAGVGLAAPQVGVPVRLFVCNPTGEPEDGRVWVNPRLFDLEGSVDAEEGCLSIPGVTVPKRRAQHAVIEGFDLAGNRVRAEADDLLARIWQHEVDHLDGVLVIDGMADAAELANRKTLKQLEADYAAANHRRGKTSRR